MGNSHGGKFQKGKTMYINYWYYTIIYHRGTNATRHKITSNNSAISTHKNAVKYALQAVEIYEKDDPTFTVDKIMIERKSVAINN